MGNAAQNAQVRTPPTGVNGFVAAGAVNVFVAIAFWFAGTSRYGFSGIGAISYHYEDWLLPTMVFLGITVVAGLASLAVRGWRRFGAGLISGAVAAGLLDLVWTLVYFVSQGS